MCHAAGTSHTRYIGCQKHPFRRCDVQAGKADGANIQLTADIKLTEKLIINGKTITIDLCGHKLYREPDIWASNPDANVLNVANGSNLTLTSSASGGIIEGGIIEGGAGIRIPRSAILASSVLLY